MVLDWQALGYTGLGEAQHWAGMHWDILGWGLLVSVVLACGDWEGLVGGGEDCCRGWDILGCYKELGALYWGGPVPIYWAGGLPRALY